MTHDAYGASAGTQPFYSYCNEPPQTAKKVCGQAAVAAMLDFYGVHGLEIEQTEYGGLDGKLHWPNAAAINAVAQHHPPDYLFGMLGTTPHQIVAALQHWGLWADVRQPSDWEEIEEWAGKGLPVITIVNRSRLGERFDGSSFLNRLGNRLPIAHWAIIYRVEDPYIYVANTRNATRVHKDRYRRAMKEWWMAPFKFGNCAIFVAPRIPSKGRP